MKLSLYTYTFENGDTVVMYNCATDEGMLLSDGRISWNSRYEQRRKVVFGGIACKACRIFPMCHGGCSQDKLEASDFNLCIKGFDDDAKEAFVANRVNDLIAMKKASLKR